MASLWNGVNNAERYYNCYINANLDKDFYVDGNKPKYMMNERNQFIKTTDVLNENTIIQPIKLNNNQAEVYKFPDKCWYLKCKVKNDRYNNTFWLPFSSIKKSDNLKGTDLKLNKGNISEGIFFASVMCLFTEQRKYFNIDKIRDIKDITVQQVRDFIKKEISVQYNKLNKDLPMYSYVNTFNNIPNFDSNEKDIVSGELILNAVDGYHFINIDDAKISSIFNNIISDCLSIVNNEYLKKMARAIYLDGRKNNILITAKGPEDATKAVKEDITITIDGNPLKISLKNGSSQLGQFGISAKSGEELYTKINGFFNKFFNINLPSDLKIKFNNITVTVDSISDLSHQVVVSISSILSAMSVSELKKKIIKSFLVAMSGNDKDVVLFDIGHKLIKDISDYEKIINSCEKFKFVTSKDKIGSEQNSHGQIDCYGVGNKMIPETMNKDIHLFKIRFKITGTEKRIYFENGMSNSGNIVSVNKILETMMKNKK